MFIEKLVSRYKDELPGYKIVGYSELCIPIFKRLIHCLMMNKKRLQVVDEFVFRLYSSGVELDDMPSILGLDNKLIQISFSNLIGYEFIDNQGNITDLGNDFINTFHIDEYEKQLLTVSIDGLIGKIEVDQFYLMSGRALRESGLKAVKPLIDLPDIKNISVRHLNQAIKSIKKEDEENSFGDIVDLYHIEGKTTNYKRLNLLIFDNNQGDTRFMVYDGWKRMQRYEEVLIKLEDNGSQLIKYNLSTYFNSYKPQVIKSINKETSFEGENLNVGEIFDLWTENIKCAKTSIVMSIPLIDLCDFSDIWLGEIKKALERKLDVSIFITGREFSNSYQKNQYEKLMNLKKKYKMLQITNYPYLDNKVLIIDSMVGFISDFEKHSLNLPKSKECYAEYGYRLTPIGIESVMMHINHNYVKDINKLDKDYNNKWINQKILNIVKLYNQFDDELKLKNGIGWLGDEPIPDISNLIQSPLAIDENTYKIFINNANKSLVESVERFWSINGMKKYFWEDFKKQYSSIQKVLHKIKLYRHSTHHLSLEDKYKPTYFQFLDDDLNGSMPQFVEDGFLKLQVKLLQDLQDSLESNLK
ncbi:hypothetical protein HMPREF1982_02529 [Clostridiales bacterium oral taxon 876 str. F0540]|nr:hypothetical protein HMPREF1982_02529 [Clostridiales bacterium oral taxon 876 str. F0540]